MELRLPESIKENFWKLFFFVMLPVSIHTIFYEWEFQHYGFNEPDVYGTLFFALIVCACESALITVFLLWVYDMVVKRKAKQHILRNKVDEK
ncbi:hypothetical protein FZC84_00145 [Rossellomorea vietnamensis]|uniref:Uncharacterized protein n=1 Tax=Rossellomorea vietnamensis TaxID=218284 RepID=A0A5D4MHS3_9BACI|nr:MULTISPECIES: hypothetical protein [Bacillaceae]TYS01117.1 hypothetical protein FZC84_00145 [Rossellomorea vietnamensis]